MSEKKFSKITIYELSDRAQINRKTFYRHYTCTADVLTEIENELLSELSEILKSSGQSCIDIGGVLKGISALIERRRDFFVRMMKTNSDLFNIGKLKSTLLKAVSVSLKNVGEIDDPDIISAVSNFVVSGVISVYSGWFDDGCSANLDNLTEIVKKLAYNALKEFVSPEKLSSII